MKYVLSLLIGVVAGAAVGLLLVLNNPLAGTEDAPPTPSDAMMLPVTGQGSSVVMQSATGYPWVTTIPSTAREPNIKGSKSAVTVVLTTANGGRDIVYATRIRTLNNDVKPLFGAAGEGSLWHIVVPGKGSLAIYSEDNVWPLIDALLVPFTLGDAWAGKVDYTSTMGPVGRYARVIGLSGEYKGRGGKAFLNQKIRSAMAGRGITDESASLYLQLDPAPAALEVESQQALLGGDGRP
ncbi:MAG: hypothetical protein AAAFM81_04115 [Pseudomonadota bacterium]